MGSLWSWLSGYDGEMSRSWMRFVRYRSRRRRRGLVDGVIANRMSWGVVRVVVIQWG